MNKINDYDWSIIWMYIIYILYRIKQLINQYILRRNSKMLKQEDKDKYDNL